MRTKIGKRIGPVPIALVAVLALAAFISVGFWLVPDSAHAQSATRSGVGIDDVVLDVNEALAISAEDVGKAFVAVPETGQVVRYRIESDQADADTDDAMEIGIGPGAIGIDTETGVITAPADFATPARADLADRTATITVIAEVQTASGAVLASAEVNFDVTIVENPILADGDMVANPDSWVNSGDCVVGTTGTDVFTSRNDETEVPEAIEFTPTATPPGVLVSGGDCTTADDSVEVSFTSTITTDTTHIIYVTGGSKFRNVMPDVAKEGLNEHILRVPAPVFADEPGEATIEVTRSMANDDGLVYLIGYGNEVSTTNQLKKETTFRSNAEFVVEVRFLNLPAAGDDKSHLALVDAEDPTVPISEVPEGEEEASVMITVTDANEQALPGARVTFIIEDAPDSVVFQETTEQRYRTAVDNMGKRVVVIEGLPEDDPFKYNLKAELDNGPTLEKNIIRMGNPEMVTLSTYAICDPGECEAEDLVLAPGDSFFVVAKAMDTAGNDVSKGNFNDIDGETADDKDALTAITGSAETEIWWNTLDCAAMVKVVGDDGKANADNPFCSDYVGLGDTEEGRVDRLDIPDYFAAFEIDGEAEIGMYSVEATTDNDKTATASIIVSGDAMQIMVSCDPVMIPVDTGLTECTATVTDAMGNIPSNLGMEENALGESVFDTVRVAVRSRDVQIIGVDDNNDTTVNNKGTAAFSILLREDATEGSSITVNVSSDIGDEMLRANTTVTYGEAAPEPEPMPMLLGAPSITSVMSDAAGMATVMLTPGDNASKHWVWAAPTDGSTGMWHGDSALAGDADMVTFSALTSGMNYWFIAVAGRGEGDASEWSAWSSWTAETPIQ